MQIRNLQREDLDIHYFKLLNELSSSLSIGAEKNFDKLWSNFSDNDNYHIVVAFSDFSILGTASLFIEKKINGVSAGHIEDVVVSRSQRGIGIGGLLIKNLIKTAKKKKCYKIILNCSDKNVPFYEKLGFLKIDNGMKKEL